MSYWWKSEDSEAQKEEEKYSNPAPSRTFILHYLRERVVPLHYGQLCSAFALDDPDQLEALRRRLIAMCRDGELIQNRKQAFCLPDKMELVSGRVQGHKDGFGFLIPDDKSADFFLTPKQMESLFDGDKVMVRETEIDHRQRRWCVTVEVLKRAFTQIVGVYHERAGVAVVDPDNSRLKHEILVVPGGLTPTEGQYVVAEIKDYPSRRRAATAVIKEILGFRHESGMEIEVALRSHNIPHVWPDDVVKSVKRFSTNVDEKDKAFRVDLRNLPLVTIDGEDARDFDDAVYAERKKSGGWRLYVAIADVSHYVRPNDALDTEAQARGTSVYFPGQVIPMLPEILSNGLCSLNPNVDRLAMICEMTISEQGKLSGYTFYEGLIKSYARLTYNQVGSMLETPDSARGIKLRNEFSTVSPHLETLYSLYKVLRKVREGRGAIDFDTVETRILFDNHRKIKAIVPTERNDAHKLIEECMLCANQATAKFFDKHGLTSLFRIHKGPTEQKLETLYAFLGELGLSLPGKSVPTPEDYQTLLANIQARPDVSVVQTMLLRSLSQAEYHPDNIGHFGLAFDAYAHFTSPIRRYPDLLAHRAIRHIVRSTVPSRHVRRVEKAGVLQKSSIYPYEQKDMLALGDQCSSAERRADEAVRDAVTSLKCQYIQQHLGEVYPGKVASVTGFGLFVELDDIYVSGLVHISSLPDDYYHFDSAKQRLVGEHSRRAFSLGDTLNVQVMRVSVEDKIIDFELEGGRRSSSKRKTGTGSQRYSKNSRKGTKGKTWEEKSSKRKPSEKAGGRSTDKDAKSGRLRSAKRNPNSLERTRKESLPASREELMANARTAAAEEKAKTKKKHSKKKRSSAKATTAKSNKVSSKKTRAKPASGSKSKDNLSKKNKSVKKKPNTSKKPNTAKKPNTSKKPNT